MAVCGVLLRRRCSSCAVGFGGSCFKKDILNLVYLCKYFELDEVASYWENVLKINEFQKRRFSLKIIDKLKKINNPTFSILGWAFKKDTNDSRESASIDIVKDLLKNNICVNVYDPMVAKSTILNDLNGIDSHKLKKLKISSSFEESLIGSYGIGIITEWDEFNNIDFNSAANKLVDPIIFIDGRNMIDQKLIKGLFKNILSLDT